MGVDWGTVQGLELLLLVGLLVGHELPQHDSKTEDVGLFVIGLVRQNLRRHVHGRTGGALVLVRLLHSVW